MQYLTCVRYTIEEFDEYGRTIPNTFRKRQDAACDACLALMRRYFCPKEKITDIEIILERKFTDIECDMYCKRLKNRIDNALVQWIKANVFISNEAVRFYGNP